MNIKSKILKKEITKGNLLLPRGYLSWSALQLFESSEKRYCAKYFDGVEDRLSNDYMTFGKRFATAKETGDCEGDPMLEFAMNAVPSYGNPEYKLESELKTPYGAIKLLSFLDDFDPDLCRILEYKTGTTKWTQAKVQKHGQLHFYAVSVNTSIELNPEQTLVWIQTDRVQGEVRPTGMTFEFPFQASLFELKEMERRITTAGVRIDKLYREHLKNQI